LFYLPLMADREEAKWRHLCPQLVVGKIPTGLRLPRWCPSGFVFNFILEGTFFIMFCCCSWVKLIFRQKKLFLSLNWSFLLNSGGFWRPWGIYFSLGGEGQGISSLSDRFVGWGQFPSNPAVISPRFFGPFPMASGLPHLIIHLPPC
jgi:hypothetical protein